MNYEIKWSKEFVYYLGFYDKNSLYFMIEYLKMEKINLFILIYTIRIIINYE